jgi:hypothetical protein
MSKPAPRRFCTCPKTWKQVGHNDHHTICIQSAKCKFCTMEKTLCKRMRICPGVTQRENPRQKEADQGARFIIFIKLVNMIVRNLGQINALKDQTRNSCEKESCIRRASNCEKQYDVMKLVQTPSSADISSAETCLYKTQRVYYDMKSLLS